jgi:ferredoxin
MSAAIPQDGLRKLVAGWLADGKRVFGPRGIKPGLSLYQQLRSADELQLGGWIRPANSIKEVVFPRHEALYGYRIKRESIELFDLAWEATEQIVIGAHPCDAAALPILDKVFNWDYKDEFYNRRRAAATVITFACASPDDQCFCTSVGLAPDSTRGSDAVLVEKDGGYEVLCASGKAATLLGVGTAAAPQADAAQPGPAKKFDPAQVAAFARDHFEDPFWARQSLACVGCGACAYTCPVCHCFDIVDEGNTRGGERVRNWDACQFPFFTLHASGHNPRRDQAGRQRQRIYHKFFMYPEKFGEILCTGCGNCARNCPEGLGVLPVVTEIPHG